MADDSLQRLLESAPLVNGDVMTLVGGVVDETALGELHDWLRSLGGGPWWTFCELTDQMRLGEGITVPTDDLARLVWARWFGAAGDLEVRREGSRFRWRWVGGKDSRPPDEIAETSADFFTARGGEPAPVLRRAPEAMALLWDARDARIATADAKTLAFLKDGDTRLQLRYTAFYDHGVVAAVRYHEIQPARRGACIPAAGEER